MLDGSGRASVVVASPVSDVIRRRRYCFLRLIENGQGLWLNREAGEFPEGSDFARAELAATDRWVE
jgi:hypothetical protein